MSRNTATPDPGRPSAAPKPRPRSAEVSRKAILSAAREDFGRSGYERATIRSVAAAAGVDPALVMRYFGNKAGLFAQAAHLELQLPDVTGLAPDDMATALIGRFFEVWEDSDIFLAVLRAAVSSEDAAQRLRQIFIEQAAPTLSAVAVDQPERRVALVGSQVIGFVFARYVIKVPPLATMTREDVMGWLGPTVVRYLLDPLLPQQYDDSGTGSGAM